VASLKVTILPILIEYFLLLACYDMLIRWPFRVTTHFPHPFFQSDANFLINIYSGLHKIRWAASNASPDKYAFEGIAFCHTHFSRAIITL
jgi:hypothetical protein